uniref:60S ribosomal protein L21 n=1 Tax=Coccolithus braarudii TaxID=221442 RepID=A0A7S0Q6M4_9EUKA|mmetsp:Transcript_19656/g.32229  ORF Transcript_19656/g.32229 Transcript_19656/m.32229 type:complete len:162 (+) Transcript_19656:28-513(+)|eukprot:CAMPEP_0184643412 /NCGR_PEP_ID=MMETSP0308-20130426/251_1 /TAXON_ID=38269 /ORGANISM="Gloeochaete witrockiana, Strain SAG 46.84" /LENGTH=161 /DNA_ID=CAMNT_0027071337 /DNA_START=123 /DNA_END=608 /DNA_ORIENTATION=+
MPHSYGYRARTRYLFSRPFRRHGPIHLSTYLRTYKIGDYVDVKGDGSIQKGMPFKFYHGRTGIVWNVTKRAVGVEVNKQVRNRIIKKRILVRVDHVQKSNCRKDFLDRVKSNDKLKEDAHKAGKEAPKTKRFPAQPKKGYIIRVKKQQPETIAPIPFEHVV